MRRIALGLFLIVVAACGEKETRYEPVLTQELQESMTPREILDYLKEYNAMFARGERIRYDDLADAHQTAHGQYPAAAFVDCIDSRLAVDTIFNIGLGSAFSANVAGSVVDQDVLGGLEYACKIAGSKVVVVLGHTNCGAVKGACDGVKLGNLTQLLAKIQPAIDSIPYDGTPRNSKNKAFTDKVAAANVRLMVQRIRNESAVLREMEAQGKILIVGALYDVETSLASWFED
jgi:carbonic anhydrase